MSTNSGDSATANNGDSSGCGPRQRQVLKFITYLSPGIPLDYFETIAHYLEEVLDVEVWLMCETRWSGPAVHRTDPFKGELCDIGVICSTSYLKYLNQGAKFVDLIGAAPLHRHVLVDGRPVYFSDIIINKNNAKLYKEFSDLKGARWAYNDPESLSGNILTLMKLKDNGENASFFGHILQSGSHLNSIELVVNGQIDAAAIDSNVLSIYKHRNPLKGSQIKIIETMGPSPIYPILARKSLPDEIKIHIRDALLSAHQSMKWKPKFDEYGVERFLPIDSSLYSMETNLRNAVTNLSIHPAFY